MKGWFNKKNAKKSCFSFCATREKLKSELIIIMYTAYSVGYTKMKKDSPDTHLFLIRMLFAPTTLVEFASLSFYRTSTVCRFNLLTLTLITMLWSHGAVVRFLINIPSLFGAIFTMQNKKYTYV
jgi:hypothetical protein